MNNLLNLAAVGAVVVASAEGLSDTASAEVTGVSTFLAQQTTPDCTYDLRLEAENTHLTGATRLVSFTPEGEVQFDLAELRDFIATYPYAKLQVTYSARATQDSTALPPIMYRQNNGVAGFFNGLDSESTSLFASRSGNVAENTALRDFSDRLMRQAVLVSPEYTLEIYTVIPIRDGNTISEILTIDTANDIVRLEYPAFVGLPDEAGVAFSSFNLGVWNRYLEVRNTTQNLTSGHCEEEP